MKKYLPMILSGIICIPATFHITRNGSVIISIIIVFVFTALATLVAQIFYNQRLWQIILCFVSGVILSQTISYTYWYFDFGHMDPKGNVGLYIVLMEAGVISVVGSATATIVYFTQKPYK